MIYKTKDVCCQEIHLKVEDGVIKELDFINGCNGNLKGIAALAIGRSPEDIIGSLRGITCKHRPTSCPDQLAKALENLKN